MFIFIPIFLPLIVKKNLKMKSSYVKTTSLFTWTETDLVFNGFVFFFKYEIGWMEDDFTFNVVLHPDNLTSWPCLAKKNKLDEPLLQIGVKIDSQIQKKRPTLNQQRPRRKVQFKNRCCKLIYDKYCISLYG